MDPKKFQEYYSIFHNRYIFLQHTFFYRTSINDTI